jgi:hypothetical protein
MTRQLIGQWHFDSERIVMIHTLTGQSVRYIGPAVSEPHAAFTNSGNRIWLRFEYEDRETRYPLLVEWRNVPGHGRPLVWRVDHDRSARLWRHANNTDAAHPGYGLWRRVDDGVIDAFSCWPSHPTVGRHPAHVVLNAGWLNGAWTAKLYRASRCAEPPQWPDGSLDLDVPVISPIDAPAPAPWMQCAPGEINNSDFLNPGLWEIDPSQMARSVEPWIRALRHMMTADGARFLVGLPRREGVDPEVQQRLPIYKARWLYADNDLVTDSLVASIGKAGPEPFVWGIRQMAGLNIGLRSRSDGLPISNIRTMTSTPAGEFHGSHPPNWVTQRLGHSLIDACLSNPGVGVDLCAKSDEALTVFGADPLILSVRASRGGPMHATTSLHEYDEHLHSPLTTHFFDEERDGIVRASTPVTTIGYWSYDPETKRLINRKSDQRLTFVGNYPLNGAETNRPPRSGGQSWRFVYRDSDIEYPLLVWSEVLQRSGGLYYRWHIDHVASADLWRDQYGGVSTPAYGLWRRVDSCALDALLCWPEIETTGPVPEGTESYGGWSNGQWSNRLLRSSSRGEKFGFEPPDGQAETPFIEALDAEARAWTFVDAIDGAGQADLANIQEIAPGQYFLPHDDPLTGFEHRMPHLLRSDGKAVIFPAGCRGQRMRHDSSDTWFLYADEEVFFFFASSAHSPHRHLIGPGWPACIGLRDKSRFDPSQPGGLPADLFVQRKSRYSWIDPVTSTKNPSPAVAHRVTVAIVDAGFAWSGQGGFVSEAPERIGREQPWSPLDTKDWQKVPVQLGPASVEGGYIGGLFSSTYSLRARLAPEEG